MNAPAEPTPLGEDVDISIAPEDLDGPVAPPATSDPDEMTEGEELGGVGGGSPGGAG